MKAKQQARAKPADNQAIVSKLKEALGNDLSPDEVERLYYESNGNAEVVVAAANARRQPTMIAASAPSYQPLLERIVELLNEASKVTQPSNELLQALASSLSNVHHYLAANIVPPAQLAHLQGAIAQVSSYLSAFAPTDGSAQAGLIPQMFPSIPLPTLLITQESMRDRVQLLLEKVAHTPPSDRVSSAKLGQMAERLAKIHKYLQSPKLTGSQLPEIADALGKLSAFLYSLPSMMPTEAVIAYSAPAAAPAMTDTVSAASTLPAASQSGFQPEKAELVLRMLLERSGGFMHVAQLGNKFMAATSHSVKRMTGIPLNAFAAKVGFELVKRSATGKAGDEMICLPGQAPEGSVPIVFPAPSTASSATTASVAPSAGTATTTTTTTASADVVTTASSVDVSAPLPVPTTATDAAANASRRRRKPKWVEDGEGQ